MASDAMCRAFESHRAYQSENPVERQDFRFDGAGRCRVYDLARLQRSGAKGCDLAAAATFSLHRSEDLAPHSNAVSFGREFYAPDDEFPLLYTNVYNNEASEGRPLLGVCLVYRLQRDGAAFSSTLVQRIDIGFTKTALWSSAQGGDVRPFGNFVVDAAKGRYYAFTMRDETQTTRYFSFDLPRAADGVLDEGGVRCVTLQKEDIQGVFDCPYHHFLQGACFFDGRVYSVEGFSHDAKNTPALRVIDPAREKQTLHVDLMAAGFAVEPELITFWGDRCLYGDAEGHLFELSFDEGER